MGNPMVSIAGSVIGGMMNRSAAKRQASAMDRANEMSNMGYLDARPYVQDLYSRGKSALQGVLDTGAYDGPTYAVMNPMQTAAYNQQYDLGVGGAADATNFMNLGRGFGQNYQDIYNRASGDMMGDAINYATDMNNVRPLLDAATRDARRNLSENTLRGIDISASGSGNTNSSRAGIADAIAARGFADREADMAAQISDNLLTRSLNQQQNQLNNLTNANKNLAGVYNTGFGQGADSANLMSQAGGAFRNEAQNIMADDQMNFERQRDFEMQQLNNYNAGILGRAPTTGNRYTPNMVDPTMAGLSGALSGFGMGRQLGNMFSSAPAATQAAPVYNSMLAQNPALGGRFYGF